jgi:hypothetical protein
VLKHQGYPAAAVVSITPLKSRALGIADASSSSTGRLAHALGRSARRAGRPRAHAPQARRRRGDLEPKFDAVDRPKLAMRQHDHQLGWFDEVARRHGEASPEIRQARQLLEQTKQLYFDFGQVVAARSTRAPAKGKRGNGSRLNA